MRENTPTLLSFLGQALGVPLGAIPLSECRVERAYLLEKNALSLNGTVILLTVPYVMTDDIYDPQRNLSLYAIPEDYHSYFEGLKQELIPELCKHFPGHHFALFADHSPIWEVDAAVKCGMGVLGDNGLLITPQYGSFVFIGEVITDMPYGLVTGREHAFMPSPMRHCDGCGACVSACPGQCLPDSRNTCVSAISQKKGELSEEEASLLCKQSLIWGCDTCQLVCPMNRQVLENRISTPIAYFQNNRRTVLDENDILEMPEDIFRKRAYSWRGRSVILRNLKLQKERRKS